MIDARAAVYESFLTDHLDELPMIASTVGGVAVLVVVVPHREFMKDLSVKVRAIFTDYGFIVDETTNSLVRGPLFDVVISPISEGAVKGRSFNALYLPCETGLTAAQRRQLKTVREGSASYMVNTVTYGA